VNLPSAPLLSAALGGRPLHVTGSCPYCVRTGSSTSAWCVTADELAETFGVSRRQVERWKAGSPVSKPEQRAAAIGMIDYEVWPELLDAAVEQATRQCEAPGCPEVFTLTRSDKRFCSANCRNRSPQALKRRANAQKVKRQAETVEQREVRLQRNRDYKANAKPALHLAARSYYERTSEKQRADRKARYWAAKGEAAA
jgi:hypothetical protein